MQVILYPIALALAYLYLQVYSAPSKKKGTEIKAPSTIGILCSCIMNVLLWLFLFLSLKELLMFPCRSYTVPDQTSKIFVITGANSGLGLETARRLVMANGTVIMGCRSLQRCQQAIETVIRPSMPDTEWEGKKEKVKCLYIDLSDLKTIEHFAAQVVEEYGIVDVLINNAGIMNVPERTLVPSMNTKEMVELTLCANHVGHFLLTSLLLPNINSHSGIIINHSSGMGLFPATLPSVDASYLQGATDDSTYNGWLAYINGKKANLLFTYALNKRLGSTTHSTKGGRGIKNTNMDVNGRFDYSSSHIKAIAVHPGYTATALQHGAIPLSEWNNYLFGMTVHDGSMSQLRAATDPEAAPSGSVDSMLGPVLGGWGPAWFSIPTIGVGGEEEEILWNDSVRLNGRKGVFR